MTKLHIMSQDGSKIVPYGAIKVKEIGIFKKTYLIIVQYSMGIGTTTSIVGEFRSEFAAKEVIKSLSNLISGGPALIINKNSGIDGETIAKTFNTSVAMITGDAYGSVRQLDCDRIFKIPMERDYSGKI